MSCLGLLNSIALLFSSQIALAAEAPAIYGKMVFHRYSSYDAWDSKLYLYNFATKQTTLLGANWAIDHAMNAQFSPDGKWLTFMGVAAGQHYGNAWDIYVWQVGSTNQPINLTQGNNQRDEDPKFMFDGQRIVFKQNADLKLIKIADKSITPITKNGWNAEESMPYPLYATSKVLYAKGARSESRVYSIDQSGAYDTQLINITSYYPVSWSNGRFLYVRWYSAGNSHDQVYSYDTKTNISTRLPFNNAMIDTSDPVPLDGRYLVVSRYVDSQNKYDLYMVDSQSTTIWPLAVNSSLEELGATYSPY